MSILIVDDEQDVKFLFEQKFRKEIKNGKIDLHFTNSGEEAINFLNNSSTEIVLILSDINMPGMSGIELLKYIKTNMKDLVVIMVTAYGDDDNYKSAMAAGADGFVTKPIDFVSLKKKILSMYKEK